jgi:hypothetical protein
MFDIDGIKIISNWHARDLLSYVQLPDGVGPREFDYFADQVDLDENGDADELYDARFFEYLGSWYDTHEYTLLVADPELRHRDGFITIHPDHPFRPWTGVQTDSAFSCTLIRYPREFDRYDGPIIEDAIVVGRAHW